jgi:hypothetical protein
VREASPDSQMLVSAMAWKHHAEIFLFSQGMTVVE